MAKVINIEGLISDLRNYDSYCDLINDFKFSSHPHCSGYPGVCKVCDVPKYREKAKIELMKLKLGV